MNNEDELLDKFQEYKHLRAYNLAKEIREHPRLEILVLVVTEMCNARCKHCNMNCDSSIKREDIDNKYFKKVLKDVAEKYDPGKITVSYTGGEPLIRKDVFEIMEYANKLGYHGVLATNGTLLTDKTIDRLAAANVRTVCVSIDGLDKTHEAFRGLPGVYPKLMEYIRKIAVRPDMEVGVTTVVNKTNIDELEEMYKQFLDIGIQYWRIFPVDPEGKAKDHSDILLEKEDIERMYNFINKIQQEGIINVSVACTHFSGFKYERMIRQGNCFVCSSGTIQGTVLSNGDIIGCANVPRNEKTIEGNITKDSFVDVWENGFKLYRDINARANKKCKNCKYWKYCLGDCMHTYDFENDEPGYCFRDVLKF